MWILILNAGSAETWDSGLKSPFFPGLGERQFSLWRRDKIAWCEKTPLAVWHKYPVVIAGWKVALLGAVQVKPHKRNISLNNSIFPSEMLLQRHTFRGHTGSLTNLRFISFFPAGNWDFWVVGMQEKVCGEGRVFVSLWSWFPALLHAGVGAVLGKFNSQRNLCVCLQLVWDGRAECVLSDLKELLLFWTLSLNSN